MKRKKQINHSLKWRFNKNSSVISHTAKWLFLSFGKFFSPQLSFSLRREFVLKFLASNKFLLFKVVVANYCWNRFGSENTWANINGRGEISEVEQRANICLLPEGSLRNIPRWWLLSFLSNTTQDWDLISLLFPSIFILFHRKDVDW